MIVDLVNIVQIYFQMTTAISIEDVRREVKILKALSGHKHLVKFYDACEDTNNVYIAMEYVLYFPFDCGSYNIFRFTSHNHFLVTNAKSGILSRSASILI